MWGEEVGCKACWARRVSGAETLCGLDVRLQACTVFQMRTMCCNMHAGALKLV